MCLRDNSEGQMNYLDFEPGGESFQAARDTVFFAAIGAAPMPMLVTDPNLPDNPIVFCNQAFLDVTGYSTQEIVGKNCRLLQGPRTDQSTLVELRAAIAARKQISREILNYRKDGSAFWNALFIAPVFDKSGELIYFFGSQLDVTRRHDAEEALWQSRKMEAIGQLSGGIAHDFNNLLQVILGYTEELSELNSLDDSQVMQSIHAIRSAALRGASLTQQLLAFSRKQRLDGRVVDFNQLVDNLAPLIERTVGGTIQVEKRLRAKEASAKIDTTQAELAILNVLINARDAMPDGGRIIIETENRFIEPEDQGQFVELVPGQYVLLSITDNGVGIPPEILRRVAEPFFTTKEQGKGTGLGLSTVYGFSKQSGGALRIYSEVGCGTTVRLFFPVIGQKLEQSQPHVESAPDFQLAGESILIVEDQDDVGVLVENILRDMGYRTKRVSNAAAAIALLEQSVPVDLLFTDLIMPGGINGIALARQAKQLNSQVKVLLTTGYAEVDFERHGAEKAEFELISKPFRRAELAAKIRKVLDGQP